jgi:hypothetical protein
MLKEVATIGDPEREENRKIQQEGTTEGNNQVEWWHVRQTTLESFLECTLIVRS